jgi:phage repressor protein C with HTH and peptisase S24 domain
MGNADPSAVDFALVPRIKLRLRAGLANYETEPDMTGSGTVAIPKTVIRSLQLDPQRLLAMGIRDRGMEPMLFEDDDVVFDTSDRKLINREIYALNFNGEACVTQIFNQGGQWILRPLNPEYKPVNMKSGECFVVGRVVFQPGRVVTGRL